MHSATEPQPTFICYFGILALAATVSLLLLPSAGVVKKAKVAKSPSREKLPLTQGIWRTLPHERYIEVWNELRPFLKQRGFCLWKTSPLCTQTSGGNDFPQCDNFMFLTPHRSRNLSLVRWSRFLTARVRHRHAARMNGVRDVVLRVIVASGEGLPHLRVLKRLSSPPDILMSNNHILPILDEIVFQDVVILAVPKLIFDLASAVDPYYANSVEDVLHMVLQAFEATAYLHRNLIAHRDLFLSNFMIGWMPESMTERTSMTRPRVYVIDLETAVEFPEDSLESQRICSTFHRSLDDYGRPIAPELEMGAPYCPFRLDIWQLGKYLHEEFSTGLSEIDQLWLDLCAPAPHDRLTANDALNRLDDFLRRLPSLELHLKIPIQPGHVLYDQI